MKMIMMVLAMFVMSACTGSTSNSVGCAVEGSVTSLVSSAVSSQLACSNPDAVKADIAVQVAKLNICAPKGVIGDAVCGPLASSLVGGILSAIPSSWGCTGGSNGPALQALITSACQKQF